MVEEGLTDAEASRRFWIVDKDGLLHAGRKDLTPEQAVYARNEGEVPGDGGLQAVIDCAGATMLVGLSTATGAFNEPLVRSMAAQTARPIILPLSNPTARAEAKAADLIRWTDGAAIVATGSPFAPVEHNSRHYVISQCNNLYVFPAIGLAVMAAGASRVTDRVMIAASRALALQSPAWTGGPEAPLLPQFRDVRRVAREIAVAVGLEAQRAGVAPAMDESVLRERVAARQWFPEYAIPSWSSSDATDPLDAPASAATADLS